MREMEQLTGYPVSWKGVGDVPTPMMLHSRTIALVLRHRTIR